VRDAREGIARATAAIDGGAARRLLAALAAPLPAAGAARSPGATEPTA